LLEFKIYLKFFAALLSTLKCLHLLFYDIRQLFLDLYLAKFLDSSAKLFFP